MNVVQRAAQTLLAGLGLLMVVFLASVYAAPESDAIPADAKVLIASAGVGLGVLVIVLATAGVNSGERWAWLALWVVPAFMLSHCLLLGTWIPDGIFLVLSVVALVVTRPRYGAAPARRSRVTSRGQPRPRLGASPY